MSTFTRLSSRTETLNQPSNCLSIRFGLKVSDSIGGPIDNIGTLDPTAGQASELGFTLQRLESTKDASTWAEKLADEPDISNDENEKDEKKPARPTYYHYKRWIWVVFPWAAMCVKDGLPFSFLIARCFETSTKYLSVEEEYRLSKDTLTTAAAFKRRINVLLYQSEQKSKMKKLTSLRTKAEGNTKEEESNNKELSFFKKKQNYPVDLQRIVTDFRQKRMEKITNFVLNEEDTSDIMKSTNNLNLTSRKDLDETGKKSSRWQEGSNNAKQGGQNLRMHRRVGSEQEAKEREPSVSKRDESLQSLRARLPLLKLEQRVVPPTVERRQSTKLRFRGFGETRNTPQGIQHSGSVERGLQNDLQGHLDVSMRRLAAARQKVLLLSLVSRGSSVIAQDWIEAASRTCSHE